jgi:cation:H+ antiporter
LFLDTFFNVSDTNKLTRDDGFILILFFSIFVYYLITVYSNGSKGPKGSGECPEGESNTSAKYKLPMAIVMTLLGLGGIIFGSDLVVNNVAELADRVGISQKIISVTIVSVGTSLPELVTIVTAAKKGENNMAIGNIVGSNIFNICIVLGLPVIVFGEAATVAFGNMDIIFMILAVVLLWVFVATGRKLRRYEGIVLMVMYGFYLAYIFVQ